MEFFTATCLQWKPLLHNDNHKKIITDSLRFLVNDKRIWLYGFVIMPNHIHLLWEKQDDWANKNIQQLFLKYTAQQLKFRLIDTNSLELFQYRSTQSDRDFHFWERRSHKACLPNRIITEQKLDYIHQNPVKAGIADLPENYFYSSAKFYELNIDEWGFITHYMEHT